MLEPKFNFYDETVLKSYNLDVTMRYQLKILDELDPFTRTHSENVASITCRICEYLHCNKVFTAYCTICAYLHDIGKIFIPHEILNKPYRLTDEEYKIIKNHTLIGYKMCMDDLKLRPYALGPKYHHEKLDGSGYPEGLKGNLIPFEDQIIAVADEYDSLVTKRQYRTHVNISKTLKDLLAEASIPQNKKMVALDNSAQEVRGGKLNKRVVRALFKVVIDDTYYEINCVEGYLSYLKDNIKRISQILKYQERAEKFKKIAYEQNMRKFQKMSSKNKATQSKDDKNNGNKTEKSKGGFLNNFLKRNGKSLSDEKTNVEFNKKNNVDSIEKVDEKLTNKEINKDFNTNFKGNVDVELPNKGQALRKRHKTKAEKKIEYYRAGMQQLFENGENEENINKIYDEYLDALAKRTDRINKLYEEIRIIKKIRE